MSGVDKMIENRVNRLVNNMLKIIKLTKEEIEKLEQEIILFESMYEYVA